MTTNTTAALLAALEAAHDAITSMKVEAETAAQGDEQMMLEACETISNEGLAASETIRAILSTAAAQPPAGWVMVPVEPTPEMVTAVYNSVRPGTMLEIAHTVWRAMLEAAPKVPPMSWNAGNAGTTPGDFSEEIAAQPPVSNELGELIGSFDAAMAEGLYEALAETTDERLKDLVERRLLAGYQIAVGPSLAAAPKAEPAQPDLEDAQCRCEPSDWAPPNGYDGDGSVDALARSAQPAGEYPPLPDFDAVEQHIYGACREYVTRGMLEPIHNLMRDYYDLGRAAGAQVAPTPSEWDVRGHLAASLTCWHRLTGQEAAELVALFQGHPAQAAPAAVAGPEQETCRTCQGNGEIVKDWERYKHPLPGDVGDEAVAECPDCDGQGTVDAAPITQAAPQPVAWMHTDKLGGKQAFTLEPPPGLKAQCQPLYIAPQAAPQPAPIFGDEDHVLVPQMLLSAACSAIDKKREGSKVLAELRRYTTGDLSKAAPRPAAQQGKPSAYALKWPNVLRINLSTVFDTEAEAQAYLKRCTPGVVMVPLYANPAAPVVQGDALIDAARFASDVLAEVYTKYQVKIGPFASQAQLANVRLRDALKGAARSQAKEGGAA